MQICHLKMSKREWYKFDEHDEFMVNIINTILPIVARLGSDAETNGWEYASIFAAVDYLADKKAVVSHKMFPKIDECQQRIRTNA